MTILPLHKSSNLMFTMNTFTTLFLNFYYWMKMTILIIFQWTIVTTLHCKTILPY